MLNCVLMKSIYLILFLFLSSCGLLSENNKPIEYNSESFNDFKISESPNYTNLNSWAVHPQADSEVFEGFNQKNEYLPVDTFLYIQHFLQIRIIPDGMQIFLMITPETMF